MHTFVKLYIIGSHLRWPGVLILLTVGDMSKVYGCPTLWTPPWTVAHQTPLSLEFSWQEYWSRLPFPSPEDVPDPGIKPKSPASSVHEIKKTILNLHPKICQPQKSTLKSQANVSGMWCNGSFVPPPFPSWGLFTSCPEMLTWLWNSPTRRNNDRI